MYVPVFQMHNIEQWAVYADKHVAPYIFVSLIKSEAKLITLCLFLYGACTIE